MIQWSEDSYELEIWMSTRRLPFFWSTLDGDAHLYPITTFPLQKYAMTFRRIRSLCKESTNKIVRLLLPTVLGIYHLRVALMNSNVSLSWSIFVSVLVETAGVHCFSTHFCDKNRLRQSLMHSAFLSVQVFQSIALTKYVQGSPFVGFVFLITRVESFWNGLGMCTDKIKPTLSVV